MARRENEVETLGTAPSVLVAVPQSESSAMTFADLASLGRPEVGAHIRVLRSQRGWTQQELARRAGTTQSSISMAEKQPANCSFGVFLGIAEAFGITIGQLCDEPMITIHAGHTRRLKPRDVSPD